MSEKKRHGTCQLTGATGRFVKSHILPKALTRPEEPGLPLLESTYNNGLKRKWDSWYDQSLVIRKGEDVLRDIDTAAITELRQKKLIWSGFDDVQLEGVKRVETMETHGFRKLKDVDASAIWLFVASICWRASRSSIQEMQWFALDNEAEEHLKAAVLSGKPDFQTFPVSLIQLTTKGKKHNQTPTLDGKLVPDLSGGQSTAVLFARVYIDGVIFHLHLRSSSDEDFQGNGLFLGAADELLVTCIDFEASAQKERMLQMAKDSYGRQ